MVSVRALSCWWFVFHHSLQIVSALALTGPPILQKAEALKTWLLDGGAYIHPDVKIDVFDGMGLGLRAVNKAIPVAETLCMIPESMCIASSISDKNPINTITTKLAQERALGGKSQFRPLIDTLPEDVSFVPAMWSDGKLNDLKGTQLGEDIAIMRNEWRGFAAEYTTATSLFTLDDWLWARATLQARAFSLRRAARGASEGQDMGSFVTVFIPFITIANHNDRTGCSTLMGNGVSYPSNSFLMRTEARFVPGEQIYNSYGQISFQQKLLSFGWTDRILSQDAFCITVLNTPFSSSNDNSSNGNDDGKQVQQVEIKTAMTKDGKTRAAVTGESKLVGPASVLAEKAVNNAIRVFMQQTSCSKEDAVQLLKTGLTARLHELLKDGYEDVVARASAEAAKNPGLILNDEPDTLYIRRTEVEAAQSLLKVVSQLRTISRV